MSKFQAFGISSSRFPFLLSSFWLLFLSFRFNEFFVEWLLLLLFLQMHLIKFVYILDDCNNFTVDLNK